MRRTGAYVRCLTTGGRPTATLLLANDWPTRARETGEAWRRVICEALQVHAGSGKPRLEDAVLKATLPHPVTEAWDVVCGRLNSSLTTCKEDDSLTRALLELSGYADEASYAIGLEGVGEEEDEYGEAARLFLELNDKQSFCHRVNPQKARVLGKKHTPQQGLTRAATAACSASRGKGARSTLPMGGATAGRRKYLFSLEFSLFRVEVP
jgi:hypothetical protein